MAPLGYVSDRLKTLEHKKKDILEEQAKKEERQVMIEIERKACQEAQDLLMAQQLDHEFNNMHISSGNNSPSPTPLESP